MEERYGCRDGKSEGEEKRRGGKRKGEREGEGGVRERFFSAYLPMSSYRVSMQNSHLAVSGGCDSEAEGI